MITPADSAPVAPGQMPAAPNSGPAPVLFGGDQRAGNAPLPPQMEPHGTPGPEVMGGVTGANYVSEAPWAAPNVNPYAGAALKPIYVGGDADAGGRDDVSASVAAAVAAAEARFGEHESDLGAGGHIGDLMALPPSPLDPGVGSLGTTDPAGHFYTPPRNY